MAWDTTVHPEITLARLKASAPDVVYRELKDYGEHLMGAGRFSSAADDDPERSLAERDHPLIDLGLAQYGANGKVVSALYKKAAAGTGDPSHDRGIRLACLSNRVCPGSALLDDGIPGFEQSELRRLALEGDREEMVCLLRNPAVGGMLGRLYEGKEPFNDLPDERRCHLVEASTGNPRLNIDEDDEDGPDLIARDIHGGIFSLLETVPVTSEWLYALRYLLIDLEPSRVAWPKEGAAVAVLQRWAGLKARLFDGKDNEEEEGDFTELTFAEEFRCLVAALYGRTLTKGAKGYDIIGKASDADLVLRCAHYGNAKMTPEELRQAFEKDGAAATFAALFNDGVLLTRETRPVLEDQLRGQAQLSLYWRRCERLSKKWKWFDPRPVSEAMQMMEPPAPLASAESTEIAGLKTQLEALKTSYAQMVKTVTWGFIIVVGVLLFVR